MSASRVSHDRPHLLIVTDDEDLREFLAEGLVYGGFWISSIASGIQTLEVMRLRTFDLILIDAALGDLSALEVVRRLRGRSDRITGNAPRTEIPILAVAESATDADRDDAKAAGIDDLLVAPIDLESLVPELHRVVQTWRGEHPDRPWADAPTSRLKPASENSRDSDW